MPEIRSAAQVAEKWGRVTPQRESDYKSGVTSPLKDWGVNTAAAKDSYNAGVQEAISKDRFSKGVQEAGTEKWKRKATTVGVNRWGAGVRAGQSDYQKGFEPFREVIASTSLPQKFAKGDPRNFDRVVAIGTALHAKKVGS